MARSDVRTGRCGACVDTWYGWVLNLLFAAALSLDTLGYSVIAHLPPMPLSARAARHAAGGAAH